MPYASPSATTTTTTTHDPHASRQTSRVGGHRRSRSVNDANLPSFSSSTTPSASAQHANTAAFSPLMGVPRRLRTTAFSTTNNNNNNKPRGPIFAFPADVEESLSSSGSGSGGDNINKQQKEPLTTALGLGLGLRLDTTNLPPADIDSPSPEVKSEGLPPAIPFPTFSSSSPESSSALPTETETDTAAPPSSSALTLASLPTNDIATNGIPFPGSIAKSLVGRSPLPPSPSSSSLNKPCYTPTRSPSSPIIRKSNGSIVKSSLKSSLSSGNIPALNSPSSPGGASPNNSGAPGSRNFTRSAPSTPSIKAVHFTEKDSVVLFEKSQRPVAVSLGSANGAPSVRPGSVNGANGVNGNGWVSSGGESETETERETDALGLFGPPSSSTLALGYPFPSSSGGGGSPGSSAAGSNARIEIAKSKSSDVAGIPGTLTPATLQASEARVHLESVSLSTPTSTSSIAGGKTGGDEVFKGTILVENLSFGKSAFVRFTLDEWQTTSEVGATYVGSLPAIQPSSSLHIRSASEPMLRRKSPSPSPPSSPGPARQWDRFAFTINLSSVRHLHTRRLFLVIRYTPHEWGGVEFWDNNQGRNYCFVFEKEKVNPRTGGSSSPTGVEGGGSLGLTMMGGGGAVAEKRSSMPVSPNALKAKQQRLEMEASLEKAKVDRPVPKLPGPMSIGKSASAPALGTSHHAHNYAHPHSRNQSHQLQPLPEEDHHSSTSSMSNHHHQPNRPRSSSAGSTYPTIHLKLSNYISPSTRSPAQTQTHTPAPVYASPPLTDSPSSLSPVVNRSPTTTVSGGASIADGKQNQSGSGVGAPLSPPASPVVVRLPTPPLLPEDVNEYKHTTPSPPDVPTPTQRQHHQQHVSLPAKMRMATPPESAQASPEASLVPLPASASPSSSASDSDRDSLRIRGRKGVPPHRAMNNGSHAASSLKAGNGANSPRAPAPTGLDFATRFGNMDRRSGTTTPQPHAAAPAAAIRRSQHAKFTVGGGHESSPPSSSDTSPAHTHASPFDSPSIFDHPSSLSKTTSPGNSGTGLNNAPPEFLQKFCFFGSSEPLADASPSAFLSPNGHGHSTGPGSATTASSVRTSPLLVGGEILPGSMVGMGGFSSLGGAAYMTEQHHHHHPHHHHHHPPYTGLPYGYGPAGVASGTAAPLKADMHATRV